MTAFENATKFFVACEAPEGWAGCKHYVAEGASFRAQSEPLAEIKTVEGYCDWMAAIGTVTLAGARYELHSSSYDEATRTAVFFATYHAYTPAKAAPYRPDPQRDAHGLRLRTDNEWRQQGRPNGQSLERSVGHEGTGLDVV